MDLAGTPPFSKINTFNDDEDENNGAMMTAITLMSTHVILCDQ
jgi:hypothetical protein